jgi:hypothetical protein
MRESERERESERRERSDYAAQSCNLQAVQSRPSYARLHSENDEKCQVHDNHARWCAHTHLLPAGPRINGATFSAVKVRMSCPSIATNCSRQGLGFRG